MYWTLELASKLEDAPWPATKDELIDYAMRSGAPLEVIENLQEIEDDGPTTRRKKIFSSTRTSIDIKSARFRVQTTNIQAIGKQQNKLVNRFLYPFSAK